MAAEQSTPKRPPAEKHGHGAHGRQSITYKSWLAMKVRCDYPYTNGYRHYGGRGITYDQRWRDFRVFLAEMGERPSVQYDLSRLDHDGPYCKANCRWDLRSLNRSTRQISAHKIGSVA